MNEFELSPEWKELIAMSKRARKEQTLYPQLVEYLIEQRYSVKQELAINRQKENKPLEWQAYNSYCERAKVEAKILLGLN